MPSTGAFPIGPFPVDAFPLGAFTWGTGAPPADFLAALVLFWGEAPALHRISPVLYYREDPPTGTFPFARVSQVGGGSKGGRSTGNWYFESKDYQVSIFSPDQDEAVEMGEQMDAVLETLWTDNLLFANGTQLDFRGTGHALTRAPGVGPGMPSVWVQSYTYRVMIGKSRTI